MLTNFNENLHEDIEWIQGLESTGSLTVIKSEPVPTHARYGAAAFEREKIRRGCALRRAYSAVSAPASKRVPPPVLTVEGGKCDQPTTSSQAVVRARSQFPFHSINRHFPKAPTNSGLFSPAQPTNSYTNFMGNYESLPPLEQLRASLRRVHSTASKDELLNLVPTRVRSHVVDAKKMPYVKFSPEFRLPRPPTHNITVK